MSSCDRLYSAFSTGLPAGQVGLEVAAFVVLVALLVERAVEVGLEFAVCSPSFF